MRFLLKCMFLMQDGLTGSAWGDWANYTASPLRAFENELGVQAPTGFWDPAGELSHLSRCRVSFVSFIIVDSVVFFFSLALQSHSNHLCHVCFSIVVVCYCVTSEYKIYMLLLSYLHVCARNACVFCMHVCVALQ